VRIVAAVVGALVIFVVLLDTFETILQPRRVTHRFRFARYFYRANWAFWSRLSKMVPEGRRRQGLLSFFGPLSLLGLFAAWVFGLMFGFALICWGVREQIQTADPHISFFTYLYMSGTTLFTLGYGDVTPLGQFGRALAVCESGLGFAFLAVIISYLPGISQAFSKRETTISLLDARAGSPPSAAQLLVRLGRGGNMGELSGFLAEWEAWSAEVLEGHLSFPVLSYFRSQHDNQSWLAAITLILDTCAIILSELKDVNPYRAQLTFAMARHAVVDLSLIFHTGWASPKEDRLPPEKRAELLAMLREAGLTIRDEPEGDAKLAQLRGMYEPFIDGLAKRLLFSLPPIVMGGKPIDNWQRAPGLKRAPELGKLAAGDRFDDHFGV
jgi:hypothetical protein